MAIAATQRYKSGFQDLASLYFRTLDAAEVLAQRSRLVDGWIEEVWRECLEPVFPCGLALVAVGGYGRAELFPHSDVDLCVLVEAPPEALDRREALSCFQRAAWDAGLRLSHSVRTVRECCRLHPQNLELNYSLLDRRFLCGDFSLFQQLETGLAGFLRSDWRDLARHLCRITRLRHSKYHNSIFRLEPDIKETPGGLRDLHVLRWLALLESPKAGHARAWEELTESAVDLTAARDLLFSLRCFLHFGAGRDSNRLTFDMQEEYAGLLAKRQPEIQMASPSRWMRSYFRCARTVFQCALRWMDRTEERESNLLVQFQEWRSRLSNSEFTLLHGQVYVRNPGQVAADPAAILRLFQFCARHGARLAWQTEKRIRDAAPALREYFSASQPLWKPLREILSMPSCALALRLMHETGVLHLWIPGWEELDCLVLRDAFHLYTVDEHTLVTLQVLEDLAASSDARLKRFRSLLDECEELWLLRLALLLHDLGKSVAESLHAAESVKRAEEFLARIQLPERERRLVLFLVENHLLLSSVILSRDLDEPGTARLIAQRTQTLERLRLLTLMTYADIAGVSPEAMTAWRQTQLWRVFCAGARELARELSEDRVSSLTEQLGAADAPALLEFIAGFPTRYLYTHSVDDLRGHLKLYETFRKRGFAVEMVREDGVYRLCLVTQDRLGLFASLAGALSGFGMNILKAEAFANRQGVVLDTFRFADPHRTLELNPQELTRLEYTLEKVALGKLDVERLLQARDRRAPSQGPRAAETLVSFDNTVSEHATVCEVVTGDRPGLLYDLTRLISAAGCSIDVVLVDTQAFKAVDVFYLTLGGVKLSEQRIEELRAAILRACGVHEPSLRSR